MNNGRECFWSLQKSSYHIYCLFSTNIKDYPFVSKSFVSLTVSKKWASTTDETKERRLHGAVPDDTMVTEFLSRK